MGILGARNRLGDLKGVRERTWRLSFSIGMYSSGFIGHLSPILVSVLLSSVDMDRKVLELFSEVGVGITSTDESKADCFVILYTLR
jgi:hypothetical protein